MEVSLLDRDEGRYLHSVMGFKKTNFCAVESWVVRCDRSIAHCRQDDVRILFHLSEFTISNRDLAHVSIGIDKSGCKSDS